MAIDYKDAYERITKAFVTGVVRSYGERRIEERKIKAIKHGALYFDKDVLWMDPQGIKRKGRFKRMPSVEVEVAQRIPQGVVPEEILQYAEAIANAFLEVLRIAEENGVELDRPQHSFVEAIHAQGLEAD